MTDEELIKLARELQFAYYYETGETVGLDKLRAFADRVAEHEREKSLRLWMLLDDVDTADDIAKGDDALYRSICQKYQKRRWEILSEQEVDDAIRARGEK